MATNNLYISDGLGQQIHFDPVPLVGISVATKRNKAGYYADEYTLTLNGYIINSGPAPSSQNVCPGPFQPINTGKIFTAQNDIRNKLSLSPLTVQLNDENGTSNLEFKNARLESIEFEEGTFFQYCKWSAVLKADGESGTLNPSLLTARGIEDFNVEISIEPSDENGHCYDVNTTGPTTRKPYYSLTRNVTAVGIEEPSGHGLYGSTLASQRAAKYIKDYVKTNNPIAVAISNLSESLVKNIDDNNTDWEVYNLKRSQQEDMSAGSFSVTETCILVPSGSCDVVEAFTTSISASPDSPYYKVSIDGNIKGLVVATSGTTPPLSLSDKTRSAYNMVSNSGNFGFNSEIYKRVNALTEVNLNSQPLSVSISENEAEGEITYNLEFDNRPTNFFENVMSERIEINDTYPGDVFATIPILGRPTGPILQYTFGRTEYKRELSVEVLLDHTWIGYNSHNNQSFENLRGTYLYTKPSIRSSFRSQLATLIQTASPAQEPGVRRYFLSPPRETWNPKEGRYTLTLEWTYEISE